MQAVTIRCVRDAIEALRYLSVEERPIGGEQSFNWAHLNQIADELERLPHPARQREAAADGVPLYRFLVDGEQLEPTDENPDDDCQFWIPVDRWTAHCKYNSAVLKTIRRRVANPTAGELKVATLAWVVPDTADSDGNPYWRAATAFEWGYRIFTKGDRFAMRLAFVDGAPTEYDTLEDAKAAAQADYERRVRSAISGNVL